MYEAYMSDFLSKREHGMPTKNMYMPTYVQIVGFSDFRIVGFSDFSDFRIFGFLSFWIFWIVEF